ncbi:hypothetical protein [Pseudobacillus badius]|uniref:hypothetical protein n=1 Tax=Bacillus badius TaxID=1455 RepID=UPI003D34986D
MSLRDKIVMCLIVLGMVASFVFVKKTDFFVKGESLHLQQSGKELVELMERIEKEPSPTVKWLEIREGREPGTRLEGLGAANREYMTDIPKVDSPAKTIQYTFATVIFKKKELFRPNFLPDQLFKDLYKKEKSNTDEEQVLNSIMNKISRNNKLKDVELVNVKETDIDATAKVFLIYKDKKRVKLNLELYKTYDEEFKAYQYRITNSLWDIISEVEKIDK